MGSSSKVWGWRQLAVGLPILCAVLFLIACGTMEEKRDGFMAQGKKLYEQGDYLRARVQFRNALQIDDNFAEAYLWVGKTELKLENPRNGFANLSKAVERKPDLWEAQLLLGELYLKGGKLEDAADKINLILKHQPQNTDALLLSASLSLAQKQPQQTLKLLEKIRQLEPGKTAAYLGQALIENQQRHPEAAAATLEAGLQANPKALDLYLARARLADSQKQFDQGEASLLKALSLEPKNVQLHSELARHYMAAGQWDKAEQALRQNLQLEPDKDSHVIELTRFLLSRNRPIEAEETLKIFLDGHPHNFPARFALADLYLAMNRYGKGEKVFQEIVALDPGGPQGLKAKTQWARALLVQWEVQEADKLVAEVLKANPKDMEATLVQGLIALAQKDGLKAVNNLRIVTQDQPTNSEAWLLLARAYFLNNQPEQAKDAARKSLALKKDYQEARVFLYNLYLQKKDYDGAIREIKGYLLYDENNIPNLTDLGDVYLAKKDYGKARDTFQKIIDLQPKAPLGYYEMGQLNRAQGQPEQAVKYYELALAQDPNFMPALQRELNIDLEQKHADKALEVVRQALARSPNSAQLHQLLGALLLAENQPKEAAAALEESLSINPGNTEALNQLLAAYQKEADQQQVTRQLEERVANPASPKFYSLVLAMVYDKQKNYDKAKELYEALFKKDLFPDITRNNLAYLLANHAPTPENLDRALKLASEGLEDYPNDPRILDTVGWILCKKGDFAKGKHDLEKAIARTSQNPTTAYHLGWCEAKMGDVEKARESLKKALALKAEFPERGDVEKLLASLPAAAGKP
jgi:tetratricopeptide (TPR) repeat protein